MLGKVHDTLLASVRMGFLHSSRTRGRVPSVLRRAAEVRYLGHEGGVDDYLRYLDAQRSTFSNQTTLIQISTERQIALVDLFRSLGGGWGQTEPMAGIGAE